MCKPMSSVFVAAFSPAQPDPSIMSGFTAFTAETDAVDYFDTELRPKLSESGDHILRVVRVGVTATDPDAIDDEICEHHLPRVESWGCPIRQFIPEDVHPDCVPAHL